MSPGIGNPQQALSWFVQEYTSRHMRLQHWSLAAPNESEGLVESDPYRIRCLCSMRSLPDGLRRMFKLCYCLSCVCSVVMFVECIRSVWHRTVWQSVAKQSRPCCGISHIQFVEYRMSQHSSWLVPPGVKTQYFVVATPRQPHKKWHVMT